MRYNCFSILLLVVLLLGIFSPAKAQYDAQRRQVLWHNVGFNALRGGLGAVINKKKDQKWHQALWKGMAQGALGGLLMHTGKDLTHQISRQRNLAYAWPAHLLHAGGASIVQNAAANRNAWEHWHLNLWFFRLDYDLPEQHFQFRILPGGLVGYAVLGGRGKFKLGRSLQTGFIYIEQSVTNGAWDGGSFATTIAAGVDETNFGIEREYALVAHEVLHSLQYDGFSFVNPLFNKLDAHWKKTNSFYKGVAKWLYLDLNGPYFLGVYHILEGGFNNPCYWENYFEMEAEHYSARRFVPCP